MRHNSFAIALFLCFVQPSFATPIMLARTSTGFVAGTNTAREGGEPDVCKLHMYSNGVVLRANNAGGLKSENGPYVVDLNVDLDRALSGKRGSVQELRQIVIRSTTQSVRKMISIMLRADPNSLSEPGVLEEFSNNFIVAGFDSSGQVAMSAFTFKVRDSRNPQFDIHEVKSGIAVGELFDWTGGGRPKLLRVAPSTEAVTKIMVQRMEAFRVSMVKQHGGAVPFNPPFVMLEVSPGKPPNLIATGPNACQ